MCKRGPRYWFEQYEEKCALWVHDGNSQRPHVTLTSGKHSNGFFNSESVMEDPLLLEKGVSELVELLVQEGLDLDRIERVVGPAMGAITLAHEVSRQIARKRGYTCLRAYAEKKVVFNKKNMVFERTKIQRGERILLVEDVITTGGSVELVAKAVRDAGGVVLPFVGVLVNRSGIPILEGKKIVAILNHYMPQWMPNECPLCERGSEAVGRPKEGGNWDILTRKY